MRLRVEAPPPPPPEKHEDEMSEKTCSRELCGKKLNGNNTKGVCGSGCLSPAAPKSVRAAGVVDVSVAKRAPKAVEMEPAAVELRDVSDRVPDLSAPERARVVAEALGQNWQALQATWAEAWLDGLRSRLGAA
jgi:hypothetical protein